MNQISSAVQQMLGRAPKRISPLSASNNAILEIESQAGESFILKQFAPERRVAFRRERQMRACLRAHSALVFPAIVATLAHEGRHFLLMEQTQGESL
jgi:aminoglycoside phosphotransferase